MQKNISDKIGMFSSPAEEVVVGSKRKNPGISSDNNDGGRGREDAAEKNEESPCVQKKNEKSEEKSACSSAFMGGLTINGGNVVFQIGNGCVSSTNKQRARFVPLVQ